MEHSKKEDVCSFLEDIRNQNPEIPILIVLDNSRSHRANLTIETSEKLGIKLAFLPPYSPDLNPIEFIWKSIKRVISETFIYNLEYMKDIIKSNFLIYSSKKSYAGSWMKKFLPEEYI